MGGKRFADKEDLDWDRKINYKKIFITIFIIILVIAIIIGVIFFVKNRKKEDVEEVVETVEEVDESKLPKTYEGYDVLGQLVIEKIDLENYILDSTENDAMDKAPVKLFGETINQEGNFCIAGHNYDEIFAKLVELEVGDQFYIEDQEGIIQDYKITEILEVEPSDLTPLMPAEGKIEVTLITCEEEAAERLVIKAERIDIEVDDEEENETDETVDTNTATNEV